MYKSDEIIKALCRYFPERLSENIRRISSGDMESITEIRIRAGRPVCVTLWGESFFLEKSGGLSKASQNPVQTSFSEVNEILKSLCRYSLYSYSREISEGFITIESGIRAGLSGTASYGDGLKSMRYINGINFRIPREVKNCGEKIYNRLLKSNPCGIIICGSVASGKTTLLRDLCRLCGNRYIVSLIDERGELAGCRDGVPQNDVGINTDIFDGFERPDGILSAVRSMSPEIIFCDEISTEKDSQAMIKSAGCGVKFISTAHADSFENLVRRRYLYDLISSGIFEYAVIMSGSSEAGKIRDIRRIS
ncbi:MAG: ATPase, T2SS/T4P/T4SS family [Oscillospiraceae bacterium]|nr:ATPase, T2SS/T4P/T4SS family [Oscillospiraceae bacterium]